MPPGDLAPQRLGLLHGIDGGVVPGGGLDAEGLETGKKVFAGRGHGGQISLVKDWDDLVLAFAGELGNKAPTHRHLPVRPWKRA